MLMTLDFENITNNFESQTNIGKFARSVINFHFSTKLLSQKSLFKRIKNQCHGHLPCRQLMLAMPSLSSVHAFSLTLLRF
jgi:hypothetical protein